MLNNAKNIIYLRISHTESLNGTSLEVQEKRCRAYAELHDIRVDKVYSEITSGATEFRKRSVFQKVLDELSSGSRLIVSRLDRLSRDVVNTLTLVKEFKEQRKELCLTDVGNVHTDSISKIFITILATFAEIERENISMRIKHSKEIAKKDRKYLGGYIEYGYQVDANGDYVKNPKEQEVISSMFKLRKSNFSYQKISEIIKRKFARTISQSQVFKIMKRQHNQKLYEVAV